MSSQYDKLQALSDISLSTIYIAGGSFVAGSAVTLLALLLLDFMQRNVEKRKPDRKSDHDEK